MPAALFALEMLDTSKATEYLLRGLAVGGAFLVGYMLAWMLAKLLDRSLAFGKSPASLHRTARVLGGLIAAVIAAIFLFGPGGNGLGFGGGPGEGKGQGTGEGKGNGESTKTTQPISTELKPIEQPKDPVPPEQRVRVTLLGGDDVKDERFYLLDDDRTPHTLAEVTTAVTAKKATLAKPVGVEVRFNANNTLPRNHPAVLRLTNWAQVNGVTVSFPAGQP